MASRIGYALRRLVKKPFWGGARLCAGALRGLAGIRRNPPLESILGELPVTIVDAGAAGGYAPRWDLLGPNLRVLLFEPHPQSFAELEQQFAGDPRVRVFPCALSEHGGELTLHLARWPHATSALRPNAGFVAHTNLCEPYEIVGTATTASRSLAEVLAGEKDLDFLKADVEGFELQVLRGARERLEACLGLELEVSFPADFREEMPTFAEVDPYCRGLGFTLIELTAPTYCHFHLPDAALASKGFVQASDALYFRMPQAVAAGVADGRWPLDKLWKGAALYLAFRQYELTYVLLEEARRRGLTSAEEVRFQAAMRVVDQQSGRRRWLCDRRIREWIEGWTPNLVLGE